MNPETLKHELKALQQRIDNRLAGWLPEPDVQPARLHEAMRYAVLGGGKRMRPLLVYATGMSLGTDPNCLDIPAASVELIHAYSLIHDDLPAMDNDDLRRGRPSCHKAFDEATAILAGDALQSLAFELLASNRAHPNASIQLEMLKTLAHASGSLGMAGGQCLDLESEGKTLNLESLENIHRLKTGALIRASVRLGALTAGCEDEDVLMLLDEFAAYLGLAFQIQDDVLDVIGDTEQIGKLTGSDANLEKNTYPALLGLDEAKAQIDELHMCACDILHALPVQTPLLDQLCQQLVDRDN